MICRFMDRTMLIPACLHKIIGNNQREGIDLWEKPYPEGRIFDPPLDEREFAPEIEADLLELADVLRSEGHTEEYIEQLIEDWKNKHEQSASTSPTARRIELNSVTLLGTRYQ